MAISVAQLNEVLQNHYLPGFQTQINDKMSYLYKLIEKKEQSTSGDKFVWLARYGRSGGKGSTSEGADLPTAGARSNVQVNAAVKNFYARMQFTDKLMKASQGAASFLDEVTQQMEDLQIDSKDDLSRQLYGDGTGLITTLTAATTAGTTITVADSTYLFTGMRLNLRATAGTDKYASVTIEDVNKITNVVTIDTSVTVIIGDKVYQAGAYNAEITGLGAIMNSGNTLYNIDRSTNSWFNANVVDLSDDLDDGVMTAAIQTVDKEAGEKPNIIIAGYGAYRNLVEYLSAFQRYNLIDTRYDAGHKALHYNDVPVEEDKYQKDDVMDFLSTQYLSLMHIGETFSWMSEDGAILNRVPNKAAYEATLVLYAELCAKYPKANLRLKNITTSSFTFV